MKILLLSFGLSLSLMSIAQTSNNLPDSIDSNNVKASEEAREGEIIDSRDSIDLNDTPANLEQRQEEETLDPNIDVKKVHNVDQDL